MEEASKCKMARQPKEGNRLDRDKLGSEALLGSEWTAGGMIAPETG